MDRRHDAEARPSETGRRDELPKFIIERSNFEAIETVLRQDRRIRLERTFLLGGRVFDVYAAPERGSFDCVIRRPRLVGASFTDH